MNKPLKAFITYSHEDDQKRKKLRTCLAVMERNGKIKFRDDTDITAGAKPVRKTFSKKLPIRIYCSTLSLLRVLHLKIVIRN